MTILRGWKYVGFISAIVGTIGIAIYPIIIDPMINTEKYISTKNEVLKYCQCLTEKVQAQNRAGVNQEAIQPGNMKVWSNPFESK